VSGWSKTIKVEAVDAGPHGQEPHVPASVFAALANIYLKENSKQAAIVQYRRALAFNYGCVGWRLNLPILHEIMSI